MPKDEMSAPSYTGPIPDPDILTAKEFWKGTQNQQLVLPKCKSCKEFFFYPRIICPKKGCHKTDIAWEVASGKGTLYTFAIQHVAIDGWKEKLPFVTAFIDTDEKVRMLSVLKNVDPTQPQSIIIGSRVEVKFEYVNDDISIPYWEIVNDQ
jgi:uncharacterized OB-fold protein